MFYVRKLSNHSNLFKLKGMKNVASMEADILKQEFGTSQNTLSFWKCEDVTQIDDTYRAILLSTTAIKVSQFVIIDETLIIRYGLSMDDTEPGKTGYKGYERLHINMTELTYEKIGKIMLMIKETISNPQLAPKLEKDEVKAHISMANQSNRIDFNVLHPDLKRDIEKYIINVLH